FQKICRTNVGMKTTRNQRNKIHEGLGRLAPFLCEIADFLESQNMTHITIISSCTHSVVAISEQKKTPRNRRSRRRHRQAQCCTLTVCNLPGSHCQATRMSWGRRDVKQVVASGPQKSAFSTRRSPIWNILLHFQR